MHIAPCGTLYSHEACEPIGGLRKRAMDICLAACGFLLLFPLFFTIAGLIKIFEGGPILISHKRVGENGRMFGCLKFRTMVVDSDKALECHLRESAAAASEWASERKLKLDPRITPLGAILRKSSIDELPQLFNILRGEMSIVGPRPIVVDELAKYGSDLRYYLRARPGVTGLWQVSGRNDAPYESRVKLDRAYVEGWNLRRDLLLVLKTIPVVLFARGCF
jgi:exopolysaccharide production protein ExoY